MNDRTMLAAMAMNGLLASDASDAYHIRQLAEDAVSIADALLKELNKEGEEANGTEQLPDPAQGSLFQDMA